MHREYDVMRPSNNKHNYANYAICYRNSFLIESVCDRPTVVQRLSNGITYYAHHRFCSRYSNDPQSERDGIRENLGAFISNLLFPSDLSRCAVSPRKTSRMETLAVTLALTENSNVAQTLDAHLRRKHAVVTSS